MGMGEGDMDIYDHMQMSKNKSIIYMKPQYRSIIKRKTIK